MRSLVVCFVLCVGQLYALDQAPPVRDQAPPEKLPEIQRRSSQAPLVGSLSSIQLTGRLWNSQPIGEDGLGWLKVSDGDFHPDGPVPTYTSNSRTRWSINDQQVSEKEWFHELRHNGRYVERVRIEVGDYGALLSVRLIRPVAAPTPVAYPLHMILLPAFRPLAPAPFFFLPSTTCPGGICR